MKGFCANISMLFSELPLRDRFAAAAEAGFPAVEILAPYSEEPGALAAAARAAGIRVVLINVATGDIRGGARGSAADPDAREPFRKAFLRAMEYGEQLGVERVNLLPGCALDGDDRQHLLACYADNLRWAAEQSAPLGIRIDVEALNRTDIPGSLLPRQRDAVALVRQLGTPGVQVQFDYYHTLRGGDDPVAELEVAIPWVGHIQFAHPDGRCEPAPDDYGFLAFLAACERLSYSGWVSAEYRPRGSSLESLAWFEQIRNQRKTT